MIRHIHITSASDFEATKFAYNSDNSMYFTGSSSTVAIGIPDINYEDIVFIKSASCIYTHGKLYPCPDISTLESLSHTQNTDNKILDDPTTTHTKIECKSSAIEQTGKQYIGRNWQENNTNAITVGSGVDAQNPTNIHELTWTGTSWTKEDVTAGGTQANPAHRLSNKVDGICISETNFEALQSYQSGFLYFVYEN